MKNLLIALITTTLASPAMATDLQFVDAEMAKRYCSGNTGLDRETQTMMSTACSTTMMDAYLVSKSFLIKSICPPNNLSTEALGAIVASYQLRHAAEIKDSDHLFFIALGAIKETWPCPPK